MDQGLQKEIEIENKIWNERLYRQEPYKGGKLDRFPLSPSQIGKCALALGRNVSHYLGIADYPRGAGSTTPRLQRVFARGHLLEEALVEDFEKQAGLKVQDRQKEVVLLTLPDGRRIKGNIDGNVYHDGMKVTVDFKSKGARYAGNFADSIQQFFEEMKETGLVEEFNENAYFITDPKGLFHRLSLDEFFVDYLLQLNSYGVVENSDYVTLYYENKNTCANYEVKWEPNAYLFEYAVRKLRYIYTQVTTAGAESIQKEYQLGSARCRLCEYNELCYGAYTPPVSKVSGILPADLESFYLNATRRDVQRSEEEVLKYMQEKDLTHVELSNGTTYERKWLKTPKPHYELRLTK